MPTDVDLAARADGGGRPADALLIAEPRAVLGAAQAHAFVLNRWGGPDSLAGLRVARNDRCRKVVAHGVLPRARVGANPENHKQPLVRPHGRDGRKSIALQRHLHLPLLFAGLQVERAQGAPASPRLVPLLLTPEVASGVHQASLLTVDGATTGHLATRRRRPLVRAVRQTMAGHLPVDRLEDDQVVHDDRNDARHSQLHFDLPLFLARLGVQAEQGPVEAQALVPGIVLPREDHGPLVRCHRAVV
mmetsp:Transcript_79384/g.236527  ORF Transcript_79384/g.236527 Transcript_79384/m.236527 type:complete len:246 (+) Transcript_79384:2216-2953(+)